MAVVAVVYLTHVVLLVLGLTTGRTSWTTDNPWVSIPGLVAILLAITVVLLVNRRLPARRWPTTSQVVRWFCLAYGSAVRKPGVDCEVEAARRTSTVSRVGRSGAGPSVSPGGRRLARVGRAARGGAVPELLRRRVGFAD